MLIIIYELRTWVIQSSSSMEFVIAKYKLWPKQVRLFHFKISSVTMALLPLSVVMQDSNIL